MDNIYNYVSYPELYYSIESKVGETIDRYFEGYDNFEDVSQNEIEGLIDEVYREMASEISEIEEDSVEIESKDIEQQQLRPYYGRRRLLRDMIGVILIGELLRRRRRGYESPGYYYPEYRSPEYGYPGYGYDNIWYGPGYGY